MALTTLAVMRDDLREFNKLMLTYSASKGKRVNSWDFFTVVLKTYKESGKHGR
jgi:hypothetical protein